MSEISDVHADELRTKLQPFLTRNPETDIATREGGPVITHPWGDDSLELNVNPSNGELIDALNAVTMPPRFTALWHEDDSELEVIYTAFRVDQDLQAREFDFRFQDSEYNCTFGPASKRLLAIARAWQPKGPSRTSYRNLRSFYTYVRSQEEGSAIGRNADPTSFWVRGITKYEEPSIIDLIRSLNFYMSYFDSESPVIVVHETPVEGLGRVHPNRYRTGDFPGKISGRNIDQHLLGLWESASTGDTFLRFLHYYQILEYASFYYTRDDVVQTIERVLTAPDTAARPHDASRQILDAMVADKSSDETKMREVIRRCVDPKELWRELAPHRDEFSEEVTLDGGFVVPTILSATSDLEDFAQSWKQDRFSQAHQRIRNALVHARESRHSTMIAPTRSNHDRLFLWLRPLSFTAASVMLYGDL